MNYAVEYDDNGDNVDMNNNDDRKDSSNSCAHGTVIVTMMPRIRE